MIDRSAFSVVGLIDRVDETHSALEHVEAQALAGVDYVKLYEALTPDDLAAAVAAAHAAMVENWRTAFGFDLGWTPDDYAPRARRLAEGSEGIAQGDAGARTASWPGSRPTP